MGSINQDTVLPTNPPATNQIIIWRNLLASRGINILLATWMFGLSCFLMMYGLNKEGFNSFVNCPAYIICILLSMMVSMSAVMYGLDSLTRNFIVEDSLTRNLMVDQSLISNLMVELHRQVRVLRCFLMIGHALMIVGLVAVSLVVNLDKFWLLYLLLCFGSAILVFLAGKL